ncbi:hypothetical protein [Methylobacterium sp. sgz302541]
MSRYVRLRAAPPRAANDNRHPARSRLWPWVLAFGAAPTLGMAVILALAV